MDANSFSSLSCDQVFRIFSLSLSFFAIYLINISTNHCLTLSFWTLYLEFFLRTFPIGLSLAFLKSNTKLGDNSIIIYVNILSEASVRRTILEKAAFLNHRNYEFIHFKIYFIKNQNKRICYSIFVTS